MKIVPSIMFAKFMASFLALCGFFLTIAGTIAGLVLVLTKDEACDYVSGCTFLDRHPYALFGLTSFISVMTVGVPALAIGLYLSAQLRIQEYRLATYQAV